MYDLLDLQFPIYFPACDDSTRELEIAGMGILVTERRIR